MINAVIIDDEKKAAEVLSHKIKELDDSIQVLKKIYDAEEAIEFLKNGKIDIVFLDIEMPLKSGFDILKELDHMDFEIIFVTGYQNYAIQAIRFSAIGYILKPVDEDDLLAAIKHAKAKILEKKSHDRNRHLLDNLILNNKDKKIGIPTMYGLEFVKLSSITRCEGLQKCTKVVLEEKDNIISSYNIGEFIKLLGPYGFFATHKSHLINMSKIRTYMKEGTIHMEDDSVVPLARRRKLLFMDLLEKI